jgi:hypothetical protein
MKTITILSTSLLLASCSKQPRPTPTPPAIDLASNSASAQPLPLTNSGSAVTGDQSAAPVDMTQTIRNFGTPASVFDQITQFPAWKAVPRGAKVFDHVPIQIDGMICLWGEVNADRMKIVFPEQVTGIPVKQAFETLYVYHATFCTPWKEMPVYNLVFRYKDGSSVTNEIQCGVDVLDWYAERDRPPAGPTSPKSKIAWLGTAALTDGEQPLRFCLTALDNPHPLQDVTAIDLYSCKNEPAGCIMAMTTGRAGLLR